MLQATSLMPMVAEFPCPAAHLMPRFVLARLAAVEELDAIRITRAIGFTQFPYGSPDDEG